ncbi:MAG: 6-pyruvoyl tetrahydropterin synthase family protein [Thermoplasmata archaeon]|nr:6-pyruvoyl tetrahydropterin synthase family protein [Thermoplasmata archaeon]RLF44021.1 MAG: 6-pyruvoyl tetrahydropterin synthase family protein [Thermoplasmata archaeon]
METYIEIDGWQTNIRFSSAHVIPEYEKCGRLHGHTYAIHAKIWGERDKNGIVVDFSVIKNVLRKIAKELDHRVIIPKEYDGVEIKEESVELENNGKKYVFPKEDCVILPINSSSAENLVEYILQRVLNEISTKGMKEIEIGVDEGFGQGARLRRKLE